MSTDERMIMQIFERRDSIIERVKQQTDSYTQLLASKLLNEGIDPPSWLWKPDSVSNSKDLNKEELITRVLCPNPKPSVRCSVAKFPIYNNLVSTGDYEGFSHGNSTGGVAFYEAPDTEEDASGGPVQRVEDLERCASHSRKQQINQKSSDHDIGTSEPTENIKPKEEPRSYSKLIGSRSVVTRSMTRANIASNISDSQERSLSSIRRSKSRQRALEMRNRMKKQSESRISRQEIDDTCSEERIFALSASGIGNEDENLKLAGPCATNFQSHEFMSSNHEKMGKVSDLIIDVKDSENYVGQNMISAGPSVSYSQKCTENIDDAEQFNSPHPQCSYSVDIGDMNAAASSGRSAQHVNDSNVATCSVLPSDDNVIRSQTHRDFTDKSEIGEHNEILKSRSASLVDEPLMTSDRQTSDEQNDTVIVMAAEDDIASYENSRQLDISSSIDASGRDDMEQPVVLAPSGKLLLLDPVDLSCEIVDDCGLKGASFNPVENTNCSLMNTASFSDGLSSPSTELATLCTQLENVSSDKGEKLDRNPSAYDVQENIDVHTLKSVEPLLKTSETKLNDYKNSGFEEREPSSAHVQNTSTVIEGEASILSEDFPPGDAACSTYVSLSETIIESSSERKVTKTGNRDIGKSQASLGVFTDPRLRNRSLGIDEKSEAQDNELCIVSPEQFGTLFENFTAFDPSNDCSDAGSLDDAENDPQPSILETNDSQNFEKPADAIEVVEGSKSTHSDSGTTPAQYLDISAISIQDIDAEFEEFIFDTETIGSEKHSATVAIDADKLKQEMPSSGSVYELSPSSCPGSPFMNLPKGRCSKSSEKHLSKPEFACFPIQEDPSEENCEAECDDDAQEASLADFSDEKRRPLEDLTNLNSENASRLTKNSIDSCIGEHASSEKASARRQDLNVSMGDFRMNNIVTNIRSFLPLIPKKQPSLAFAAGKREVKIKALEAAEAAKRQQEKVEKERRLKKEALKLERAKMEERKLRKKKREEEELKEKEAEIIVKKRAREEQEEKKKENKRLRLERLQRRKEQEEKGKRKSKDEKLQIEAKKQEKKMHTEQSSEPEVIIAAVDKSKNMIGQGISYEISPYQSSDDEAEENEDETAAQKKKLIPSWASKNNVGVLLSLQQNMDPMAIFPRESFCDIDEVIHRKTK